MRRALLLAFALLVVSCSGEASGSGSYELGEFFISGASELSEPAGEISIHNGGKFPHTLVVSRPDGEVLVATDLVMPGETVSLHLDLEAGVYQFTCRIVGQGGEGQLIDHYERGMHTTVAVRG